MSSNLRSIGKKAFVNCYVESSKLNNQTSIDLSKYGLTIIDKEQEDGLLIKGDTAIACRASATAVNIPVEVSYIESRAFKNCKSIVSLTIPTSIMKIGDGAFEDCHIEKSHLINRSSFDLSKYGMKIINK